MSNLRNCYPSAIIYMTSVHVWLSCTVRTQQGGLSADYILLCNFKS